MRRSKGTPLPRRQGPVMPYLYGLFAPLWSPHGVLGGRIFTAALGLLSGLLAAGLARRAVPSPRAAEAGHPIEATGKELRKMFSWLKSADDDYVEGTAAR